MSIGFIIFVTFLLQDQKSAHIWFFITPTGLLTELFSQKDNSKKNMAGCRWHPVRASGLLEIPLIHLFTYCIIEIQGSGSPSRTFLRIGEHLTPFSEKHKRIPGRDRDSHRRHLPVFSGSWKKAELQKGAEKWFQQEADMLSGSWSTLRKMTAAVLSH